MSTSYRRLIAWSAAATIVVLAVSAGIAAADDLLEPVECVTDVATGEVVCSYPLTEQTTTTTPAPGIPVGGDCDAPLLAASYELDAPCVPFDACTGTTTLWTATPCTENDRIAQCVTIAETRQVLTSLCRDLLPLIDVCLPDGSRRWSASPCDYVAPDIGDPQVIDPVLPKTGNGSTLALIAALCVALGALCLVVRGIGRDMDDDWGAL